MRGINAYPAYQNYKQKLQNQEVRLTVWNALERQAPSLVAPGPSAEPVDQVSRMNLRRRQGPGLTVVQVVVQIVEAVSGTYT